MVGSAVPGALYPGQLSTIAFVGVGAVDTGTTISDSISTFRSRSIEDTGAAISDAFGVLPITDTAVTISDSLQPWPIRHLDDTGATVTDLLRKAIYWDLVDTGATIVESIISNNLYTGRIVVSGSAGSVSGSTLGATRDPTEFAPGDFAGYQSTVWYEWTAPYTGKFRFRVHPDLVAFPNADPWIAIYEYDPGAVYPTLGKLVFWNDDASWYDADLNDAVVNFRAEAGVTYVIQVGAEWTNPAFKGESPFVLSWEDIGPLAPVADDFPGKVLANNIVEAGNPEFATPEPGDPWYWIREQDDWRWSQGDWGQYVPSNRTMIYKFTPTESGEATVTFFEIDTSGSETGETIAFLFDGDGVADIADLDESRVIDSSWFIFEGEVFSFVAVAGRDYYLWVASDDGIFGPDGRFRMRVKWAAPAVGGAPPNDDIANAEFIGDGLWHPGTTLNATWEDIPTRGDSSPFNNSVLLDNNPVETPEPATVWYRTSFRPDDAGTAFQWRNLDGDVVIEYWEPITYRVSENLVSLVDTAATITDGIVLEDKTSWEIGDTGATITEALAFRVDRRLVDIGATVTDVLQKGPADTGVERMTDTISRRVSRKMTDSGIRFASDFMQQRRVHRGRAVSDTGATISDSIAIIELTHFDLVDTGVAFSESLARAPMVYARGMVGVGTTITDALTRIPPVSVSDTGATVTDMLVVSGLTRVLVDRGALVSDTVKTNHVFLFDYGIDFMFSTLAKARQVARSTTDTACTISDGIA